MKIQIIKQELVKVFSLAQEACEKDNINSYYSYFIFIAKENTIRIKSANRKLTFEQVIFKSEQTKLNVLEDGAFLLPGNKILNIISALHDGLIYLETNDFNLRIVEEGANKTNIEFNVRMRDIVDYPTEIHNIEGKNKCLLNRDDVFKLINNTSFAVSSNMKDSTMFLTGIFFDIDGDNLTAVATDRNRISICFTSVENISSLKEGIENDIIIPQKTILFLKKILMKNEDLQEMLVFVENEKIVFQMNDIIISANLIAGKYYDYKRIIPEGKRNRIEVNTQGLIEAISRVMVVSDKGRDSNVFFKMEQNQLIISAEEKEKGSAKETIEASIEGNLSSFLIKAIFVLDPVSIIHTENVYIEYGDSVRDLIKITSTKETDNTMHIAAQLNQ